MIFAQSLLDKFDLRGTWWVPGQDRKAPGTLRFDPERGLRLDLDAPIDQPREFLKGFLLGASYDVIQGNGIDRSKITLFGVEGQPLRPPRARLMVVGEHVSSEAELRYQEVIVELEGLEAFVAQAPLSAQSRDGAHTLKYEPPKPFATCLDEEYSLSVEHNCAWASSFGKRSLEHRARVCFGAAHETPIGSFFSGPVAAFHRLLDLACGRPMAIRRVLAQRASTSRSAGRVARETASAMVFRQPPAKDGRAELYPDDLVFNCETLGLQASDVLIRWHAKYSSLWAALAFYFLLHPGYDLDVGLELHFINAITAVEHFDRVTRPSSQRGKADKMDKQLFRLFNLLPECAKSLLGAKNEFIKSVVATRSHLLHAQAHGAPVLQGRRLWLALNGLRLMLQAGFLAQMGLEEPLLSSAVVRTKEFKRLKAYAEADAQKR